VTHRLAVLLRAINVGGTGRLAMADFKACLAKLGHAEPRTLGAAGSAVITTDDDPSRVEAAVAARLKADHGVATEVFVRTHAELEAALAANPFDEMAKAKPAGLLVLFLDGEPEASGIEALRRKIAGPEEVAGGPRCLYLAYGEGMGRSRLTGAIVERAIGRRGTGRNWNTVQKLTELTAP
jgi:uncharacterized protein (DUF1697 family)